MISKQKHTGGCLCGRIRFEVDGNTVWIGYCHCQSCRKATGGAAVTHVGVNTRDIRFLNAPVKIHASSPGVRRGFCPECGSPISYSSDRYEGYTQLYVGIFDEPERLMPQAHVHCEERISWFDVSDQLPRYTGSGDDGSGEWRGK